ncbi:tetratricopeptide (TPR) repeat protein/predicted aspartyl protease [Pelomonas saccharophila]|uniref:Tetratricopeptide (TPR) repeat protein/predicted aspartyl protease n=1 Tax=Roseateles saccharophilus TaxID=304 RepID=A0ABU1YS70_ROSSA|nr:aspartyl protease family protein [Roseateles saccharophilus]MDR7271573.1 tetratricopeptide (TPR) repeat protein/predicted aspartyl protease [Roseateles saccharophilus]
MKTTSRALATLALVAAALSAAPPAWAQCKLSKLEIAVRIVNQRPVGTLNLNGTEVSMLIDSGAFYSFLTPSVAAQLNLRLKSLPDGMRIYGYTGAIEARVARVEKVIFQRTELSNVEFIVGGNELGSGIQGILGRNFLSMADAEYDLAHGVVRLMFPKGDCDKTNFAYWAGDAPVIEAAMDFGSHGQDTAIRVRPRINDLEVRALLDTGAPRTSLKLRAAKRAGVKEKDLVEVGRVGGAGVGRVRSWTGVIASFELGGEKIGNNELGVDDAGVDDEDMLIGLDYFLSHRIYVSRLQRKLYATWNGGPVFARSAPGQYDQRYAARPEDIAPDDAESLARRGEASAARGELAQALADLNRACELAPQSGTNFFARARVHAAMKQFGKARQDLDEALRLQPGLHEALAIRASVRMAAGDRTGALVDLLVLDTALPPSSHLRQGMAETYVQLELPTDALRQWALWVPTHRSDAHMAQVLNSRCWLRARLNLDLKLALDDCKEAVSRDRGEAAFRDSLGWTQLRLNDAAAALKAFDAALEIKPLAFSHYGRGLAQQRLGNAEAARRDLAAARKLREDIDAAVRAAGFPVADDAPRPPAPAS